MRGVFLAYLRRHAAARHRAVEHAALRSDVRRTSGRWARLNLLLALADCLCTAARGRRAADVARGSDMVIYSLFGRGVANPFAVTGKFSARHPVRLVALRRADNPTRLGPAGVT